MRREELLALAEAECECGDWCAPLDGLFFAGCPRHVVWPAAFQAMRDAA